MSRKLKEVFLHSSAREHGQFPALGFIFGRKCDINLTVYTHRTIFHIDSRPNKNIRLAFLLLSQVEFKCFYV